MDEHAAAQTTGEVHYLEFMMTNFAVVMETD